MPAVTVNLPWGQYLHDGGRPLMGTLFTLKLFIGHDNWRNRAADWWYCHRGGMRSSPFLVIPVLRVGKLTFRTRDTSHVRPPQRSNIYVVKRGTTLVTLRRSLKRLITNNGDKENVWHQSRCTFALDQGIIP